MARLKAEGGDELKLIEVKVPKSRLARLDALLYDPVRNKKAYGARTKLINRLMDEWINKETMLREVSKNDA